MGIVIGIVVVLLIIGAISSAASKNAETQKQIEFNDLARSRVEAYSDYLRRTSLNPHFLSMSDRELYDLIGQKIRAYKTQTDGANTIGGIILFAGSCLAGVLGAGSASWGVFIVWMVITIGAAIGVVSLSYKSINDGFAREGFEPEKLKVAD